MDQIIPEPVPKTFRGWSRRQKFYLPGAGARNLSSVSAALAQKAVKQILLF